MNLQQESLFEKVVDGLADKGFAVLPSFLSRQEVDQLLALDEFRNGFLRFQKAGIGKNSEKQINESIRGDYISWIDRTTAALPVTAYLNRLQEMIAYVNRSLFLSLKDYEVHMTVYPVGSYYKRHLDQFKADDHRKLSVICYLNKDWTESEGGQLRLHLSDGPLDILPTAGTLVCFRSDLIEHEVLPATRERISLTGWMLDQHADLRHL